MWIRSQDKTILINSNVYYIQKMSCNCFDSYDIYARVDGVDKLLGEYSTKEKALKVLGAIQIAITGYSYTLDGWENEDEKFFREVQELPRYETYDVPPKPIFQMPQNEEVE